MEVCQQPADEHTTIISRENYLNGVKNKVVNQLSKKTDQQSYDDRDGNMKNSMNCTENTKFTIPKTPIRISHRKTLSTQKSPTKRTNTVIKLAKLLAIDGDSKEQQSFNSNALTKRLRHTDRMESNNVMHSVIHHNYHNRINNQSKHSTLNEFAKRLLTNMMLKKNSSESGNEKQPAAVQGFVSKTFRRRSVCEECSVLNDVVTTTTRLETGLVNGLTTCVKSDLSEEATKNCSFESSKTLQQASPNKDELTKMEESRADKKRFSAFSVYATDKNVVAVGDKNNKRSISQRECCLPEDLNAKLDFVENNDDAATNEKARSLKRDKMPVLIVSKNYNNAIALSPTSALISSSSFDEYQPFPGYYFPSPAFDVSSAFNLHNRKSAVDAFVGNEKTKTDAVGDETGFDENALYYYTYRLDDSTSSSIVDIDSALIDAEVEMLISKAKKRRISDDDATCCRCSEPIARTLTFGDDKVTPFGLVTGFFVASLHVVL